MRRLLHLLAVMIAGASSVALPGSARADEGPTRVRVRVDASPACASEQTFWQELSARTSRLTRDATSNDATLHVRVTQRAGAAQGVLRVSRSNAASAPRVLTGATCDEVVRGLSLVAALAFDPAAKLDPPSAGSGATPPTSNATSTSNATPTSNATSNATSTPTSTPTPTSTSTSTSNATSTPTSTPTPTSTSTSTSNATSTPTSTPTSTSTSNATSTSTSNPSPAAEGARPRRAGGLRFGAGGGAAILALGAPSSVVGYGGFLELVRDRSGLSPAFRLGLLRAAGGTPEGPARADLDWWLARAEVCPARWDLARTVHARPCAGLEIGAMTGTPFGAARAQTRTRPWLAPRASARIEWEIYQVTFIEAEGALSVPLVRDELVVDPTVSLYRAPVLVPSAQLSAGVRFP